MTTASTTLLGLALPVTGELSGTWGDVVNASLTNLLDTAIAGTTTLSSDADVTLTTTTLSANQARQAVILWTAGGTATRTITAPAQSKSYVVINATSSSQSIKLVGAGPTTGITIVAGEKCFAAWNGSDFVKIGNTSGAGVFSTVTASSLTSGRVTYAGTAGLLQDSANLLYSGTDLTVYGLTVGRGGGAVSTNTAVGASALAANTTGAVNVAVGYQAAYTNSTGTGLVAIGRLAGYTYNTNGTDIYGSTFVGTSSGYSTTSGIINTAIGGGSLQNNTTGSYNFAGGAAALFSNTTASYNTAVGYAALYLNTTGTANVAIGGLGGSYTALNQNTTGSNSVAVGNGALGQNTTASNNTAVGYQAIYNNTTGTSNTGVGYVVAGALGGGTGAINNITAIGYAALAKTTGDNNTAVGRLASYYNSSGTNNVSVGDSALFSNTTASNNTAVGYQAGYSNTTGTELSAFGYKAAYNQTTPANSYNTAIGSYSLYQNLTGVQNTTVGWNSLANCTGTGNTAIGYSSGESITSGSKNTVIGRYSGNQGGLDIRTASNYIVLSDGDGNPRGIFDSSGNLGLGVTPSADTLGGKKFEIGFAGNAIQGYLAANLLMYNNATFNSGWKYSNTAGVAYYQQNGSQHIWYNAPSGTAGNAITFTQAMTLDSSGNLLVGTTSASGKATVAQATVQTYVAAFQHTSSSAASNDCLGIQILYTNAAPNNTAGSFIHCADNAAARFEVRSNGNVQNANNSYGAISDVKLKENIVDATPKLAKLLQVKVRNYNLKSDATHKQIGVIAQELEAIFPAMVEESPDYEQQTKTREIDIPAVDEVKDADGNVITEAVAATTRTEEYIEQVNLGTTTKSVKYSVFVPMLIKAIQEQQAIITALTTRITALEAK
jgi:hypothetical protein